MVNSATVSLVWQSNRALAALIEDVGWPTHESDSARSGWSPPFLGFCSWVTYVFKFRPHDYSILAHRCRETEVVWGIKAEPLQVPLFFTNVFIPRPFYHPLPV
jgi:hypothetical protein